ncbi:type I restriction enzyme HsdR N-terminal domain-containing protein, partial [Candidatus Roizmanbacteria bacterium]|nr:type I restriction enzyme HsdR N-terminal domain-containing protein [Candidatus Roizmanbacteria bacterium]
MKSNNLFMQESLSFEILNETDVREEIIAPLIRKLGYCSGSKNNVIREQSLRYPCSFLGRKNPKKDPLLRGKADYILEVENRVRWVIEAKAPEVTIGIDDIEQAWTYANHSEVRAIYFVLCNGRYFQVYRTSNSPEAPPVLTLTYEQLEKDYLILSNLLGPDALLRDFPDLSIDIGLPIAPGLRSIARITNGLIRYGENTIGSKVLSELQIGIQEGAFERDSDGKIVVFIRTVDPTRSLQELSERLGLSKYEMFSSDSQLSTDEDNPTRFIYTKRVILAAGEKLFNLETWSNIDIPINMTFDIQVEAVGVYRNRMFIGEYMLIMNSKVTGNMKM